MLFREVTEKAASNWGDQQAIITETGSMSYNQLDILANKTAQILLTQGIRSGDKMAFLFPNCSEFFFTYFGIAKAGCAGVPLNTRLTSSEIGFILKHSGAKGCVFDSMFSDQLEPLMAELPSDFKFIQSGGQIQGNIISLEEQLKSASDMSPTTAFPDKEVMLFYTSGTTGDPKGAMIDIGSTIRHSDEFQGEMYEISQGDRVYISTPLFHISAAYLSASFIMTGVPIYITREWNMDRVLKLIQDSGITFMWAVPTMMALLLKSPQFKDYNLSPLKQAFIGGSALSIEIIKAWKEAYPNLQIHNGYAQTETGCQGSILKDEYILEKANSIGVPFPGIEMKITDDDCNELPRGEIGEIAIKSPITMLGYFKNPELTEKTLKEEWCLSGDKGYQDKEGFFYYSGRKKDMIIRGGENIFPDEIDAIVNQHPKVMESTAFGVSDPIMGEEVLTLVVLVPGEEMEFDELRSHCEKSLADYKIPKYMKIINEIPKTSTMKVNKKVLREQFSERPR